MHKVHKALPIVLVFLILALSGCTDSPTQTIDVQEFERPNPNLDAKIVDVKFDRDDIRAGEKVTTDLIIANTGNENITSETVDIKARVKTLDDFLPNLYLKTMSEEKKTRTFSMD